VSRIYPFRKKEDVHTEEIVRAEFSPADGSFKMTSRNHEGLLGESEHPRRLGIEVERFGAFAHREAIY
jgi:hypothetical protein